MGITWIIKLLKSVCACGCVRARLRCVWNCLCVCVPCICKRLNVSVCLQVRPWVYQHSQFRGCVVALISNQNKEKNLHFLFGNHGSSDSCFFRSSLSFPKLKTEHSGNYTCKASNAAARHAQSATLVVNGENYNLVDVVVEVVVAAQW